MEEYQNETNDEFPLTTQKQFTQILIQENKKGNVVDFSSETYSKLSSEHHTGSEVDPNTFIEESEISICENKSEYRDFNTNNGISQSPHSTQASSEDESSVAGGVIKNSKKINKKSKQPPKSAKSSSKGDSKNKDDQQSNKNVAGLLRDKIMKTLGMVIGSENRRKMSDLVKKFPIEYVQREIKNQNDDIKEFSSMVELFLQKNITGRDLLAPFAKLSFPSTTTDEEIQAVIEDYMFYDLSDEATLVKKEQAHYSVHYAFDYILSLKMNERLALRTFIHNAPMIKSYSKHKTWKKLGGLCSEFGGKLFYNFMLKFLSSEGALDYEMWCNNWKYGQNQQNNECKWHLRPQVASTYCPKLRDPKLFPFIY